MPTYTYICQNCKHQFNKLQKMSDQKLKECPKCKKQTLKRKFGKEYGIIFKGTGFYQTDYKHK